VLYKQVIFLDLPEQTVSSTVRFQVEIARNLLGSRVPDVRCSFPYTCLFPDHRACFFERRTLGLHTIATQICLSLESSEA